mgnify:CR=1 FL=1
MASLFAMLLVLGNSNIGIQNMRVDKALELLNDEYEDAYLTLAGNHKYESASNSNNLRFNSF